MRLLCTVSFKPKFSLIERLKLKRVDENHEMTMGPLFPHTKVVADAVSHSL